jgi:hypothetical protein
MTQLSQTTNEPREKERGPHGESVPANDERSRLLVLVGELLSENQKLRFENDGLRARAEELEQQNQRAERGLAHATKWTGMVF